MRRADTGRRGTDQHNFVLILRNRNLPRQHIVEGIDLKRRFAVTVLVEEGVHLRQFIRRNVQVAKTHFAAKHHTDVARLQVKALRRHHQRQRRVILIEVTQHQRFRPDGAIDIGIGRQMSERNRPIADRLDRHLRHQRRPDLTFGHFGQSIFCHELGQHLVRPTAGFTQRKQHRQQDIASATDALGQNTVRIQGMLGLLEHIAHLLDFRHDGRPHRQLTVQFKQTRYVGISRIDLGLEKKHGIGDQLGLTLSQQVGHLGQPVARPRPAPEIGN